MEGQQFYESHDEINDVKTACAPAENIRNAETVGQGGSEAGSLDHCSSKKREVVYSLVQSVCKSLFSRQLQYSQDYKDILNDIRESKRSFDEDDAEECELSRQCQYDLETLDKIRERRRHLIENVESVAHSIAEAKQRVMTEKSTSRSHDEDSKSICSWFPESLATFTECRKKKEGIEKHRQSEKDRIRDAVDIERKQRLETSERRNGRKNQRGKEMQKSIGDKSSRLDASRQKFDELVTLNQSDGQELSTLQEKLKKEQQRSGQPTSEIHAATLKTKQDFISCVSAVENTEAAIVDAEKDTLSEDEIYKVEEANQVIVEENNVNFEKMQQDNEEDERVLMVVTLLLLEENLKVVHLKNSLNREASNLQNYLTGLEYARNEKLTNVDKLRQSQEELEPLIIEAKELNMIITEELNVFESLVQYTTAKLEKNAEILEEKEKELYHTPCNNHLTQKFELDKIQNGKEVIREKLRAKKHQNDQIEGAIGDLKQSIKLMLAQNVAALSGKFADTSQKLANLEESANIASRSRDSFEVLENDRRKMCAKLTDLLTETCDCQDELNKLMTARLGFEQTFSSHENHLEVRKSEVQDLQNPSAETPREKQDLQEIIEECERIFTKLTDEVAKMTTERDAVFKESVAISESEASLSDKKLELSKIEENSKQEQRLEVENKQKFEEMKSELKYQQDIADEERKSRVVEVGRLNEDHAKFTEEKIKMQKDHEKCLFTFDSASDAVAQTKILRDAAKKQKIKLINSCDSVEKVLLEKEEHDNKKIETARAEVDLVNKNFEDMIQKHQDSCSSLKRQIEAFQQRFEEIAEKRSREKENKIRGLSWGPKPILKSPGNADESDHKSRRSVSFKESPDNLQILPSDSSAENKIGSTPGKRKLMPVQQPCDGHRKASKTATRSSPREKN